MNAWTFAYDTYNANQQKHREALCVLGNGYICTRGAAEEKHASAHHYPGTYLAGGYNRLHTELKGQRIENEDLVNWPNWLPLSFRVNGGAWLDLDTFEILEFSQTLFMAEGTLVRRMRVTDPDGNITLLHSRRLVHMEHPHIAALQWTLTAENWSGSIEIATALDGRVTNSGVPRYAPFASQHLHCLDGAQMGEDGMYLLVETRQSQLRMAQAARTRIALDGEPAPASRHFCQEDGYVGYQIHLDLQRGQQLQVDKVVSVYTSADRAISEPLYQARKVIWRQGKMADLLPSHTRAWWQLWRRCDIQLNGGWEQKVLRLHIFHLLQSVSPHTRDMDVGVPARGWHGEAYRGHIFWDELFIFPFLNLHVPKITRGLLMYRYRRLEEARANARTAGFRGAMYPWQSGSDGREESQRIHLNPRSERWLPDNSRLQRHVNAAIAYNVWQHYQTTGDIEFLSHTGAEMLLSIARFWASISTFNAARRRYEICGVMGPDEYHDGYPDRDAPGVDNNSYTNVMAVWTLATAVTALRTLADDRQMELTEQLQLTDGELRAFADICEKMFVPFHDDGIISQFEGYERLEEFDWDGYKRQYGNIQRLDRILEAEGDTPNRYKVAKQADVLMLFYLFSNAEITELLGRLGYAWSRDMLARNIAYYAARTSHGSTLSQITQSWIFSRSDRSRSWASFQKALASDVEDIQGGTTPEGIHLGAMAGTVDIIQRCYLGVQMHSDVLWLNPKLPDALTCLELPILYRHHWLRVRVDHHCLEVAFHRGISETAKVGFRGEVYTFHPGQTRTFDLPPRQ